MERSRLGCQIWCEECVCENFEELSAMQEVGRLVTKEGILKVPVTCQLCDAALLPHDPAECLTFFWEGPRVEYTPWEQQYVELLPAELA